MKKLNILLAFMFILSLSMTAQKANKDYEYKNTKSAENLFDETKYLEAIMLFEKAYSKAKSTKEKGFITYHIAVSNQYIAKNKEAKKYYERALRLKYDKYQEDIYRRLAQMQMQDGEYKDAKRNFDRAVEKNPNDDIARKGVKSCKKVSEILDNKTKHKVEVVKELNTDNFDWSISQFDRRGEQFIFSSCRKASTGSKTDVIIGEEYTDIYVTSLDRNGNFGEPVSLGKTINSDYHEASGVMYNNGNSILFTRCNSEKNKNIGCKIYTADSNTKLPKL